MSPAWTYRAAAAILWGLALWNVAACRGLFWDGASFLVHMMEAGGFHDGHIARSHMLWATQAPAVLALWLGVNNTAVLAIAYSFGLFAVPTALYHLALHRVRRDPPLLAAVMAIVVVVYLANSFFIVGEFNGTYAAVTAAAAVALTAENGRWRDGALLCALAALCLRSYEAMIHLGPLMAAMTAWTVLRAKAVDPAGRLFGLSAAGLFLGAAVVSAVPTVELWDHDYYVRVRAATFHFWQNLQFMIGVVALGAVALAIALRPSLLRGRAVPAMLFVGAAAFAVSPWLREVNAATMLYPPAHYISRTAAGALLWTMLAAMWLFVAWTSNPPRLFATLKEPPVGRRLATGLLVLLLAAAVPDIVLTRVWGQYLEQFRALVVGRTGLVPVREVAADAWPARLFSQAWSQPPLSLIVRDAPANAVVMPGPELAEPPVYDPACGPRFAGYAWRR